MDYRLWPPRTMALITSGVCGVRPQWGMPEQLSDTARLVADGSLCGNLVAALAVQVIPSHSTRGSP